MKFEGRRIICACNRPVVNTSEEYSKYNDKYNEVQRKESSVDLRQLYFRFKPAVHHENEVDFRWKPSKQNPYLVTKQNKTARDEDFVARNFIFLMSTSCYRDGGIFRRNSTSHIWVFRCTHTDKGLVSL